MEVFVAFGCMRYQGQEVLGVYTTNEDALTACAQQRDAFEFVCVGAYPVHATCTPLKQD